MGIFERLKIVTMQAQQEDDLPDFLAERIFALVEQSPVKQTLNADFEELIEQITLYDTYGQTGYIGMGVNSIILEGTIRRLEKKLNGAST